MRMTMLHGNKTPDDLKRWIEEVSNVTVTSITIVGRQAEVSYDEIEPAPMPLFCDIIGVCDGCNETTLVNVMGYCEFCMDDFEE